MSPVETILNLFCLDKDIVQLSDLESIDKQFQALTPADRRRVSRKIRKLAKKYISRHYSAYGEDVISSKKTAAGLGENLDRTSSKRKQFNKIKAVYAKKLLLEEVSKEMNGLTKPR